MNYELVEVGILTSETLRIVFHGPFSDSLSSKSWIGTCNFSANELSDDQIIFTPSFSGNSFEVKDVVIGKDFHWQQKESQRFRGELILKRKGDRISVINRISVEEYLKSVISSEMNADSSPEFLKAHAVISRSWLISQIQSRKAVKTDYSNISDNSDSDCNSVNPEIIRWYDHTQHTDFDVCADDHCQRYQGIGRISNKTAVEAVKTTEGEVLVFNGEICDARFSKCCGGAFETFENCWQPENHPYLKEGRDMLPSQPLPDLTKDESAEKWILSKPESFCNTSDKEILRQVLNNYDQTTSDFFRWKVNYSQNEISEIIKEKSGIDFGDIMDIFPLKRGVSGRLVKVKIVGTKKTMIIGKELEIRRILSDTHLYSSAFIVKKSFQNHTSSGYVPDCGGFSSENVTHQEIPAEFTFIGAGWGHGVGLCQIGAAMMADKGFSYREILSHYYPGSQIHKL